MPLIAAGVIGAVGSVAGGALSANAAGKAADAQSQAAMYAANLQSDAAKNALDFQKQQYYNSQQQMAPWLTTGTSALGNLGYLLGIDNGYTNQTPVNIPGQSASGYPQVNQPSAMNASGYQGTSAQGNNAAVGQGMPVTTPSSGQTGTNLSQLINPSLGARGSLMQPWTRQFEAPTDVTEKNDPGYQFRLNEGLRQLKNNATATGTIFSGATAKGLNNYAQDFASNEYGNVYNRALQQYGLDYNTFQNNQANQFNRLAALSGVGQTTAAQLGNLGQSTANNVSSTLLNSANAIGNNINNSAAAQASGYIGAGNAWGGALGGATGNLSQMIMLNQILKNAPTAGPSVPGGVIANLPLNQSNPLLYYNPAPPTQ